jgi:hypothetical protein
MADRTQAASAPAPSLPRRLTGILLGGAAVLVIGIAIVQQGLVRAWAEGDAPMQLAPSLPESAEVSLRLALAKAGTQDWPNAQQLAAETLARSPINSGAVRIAGLAAEMRKAPEANDWLLLAGQLGWRDTPLQLWQVAKAAEYGDITNLVLRADGLLARTGVRPHPPADAQCRERSGRCEDGGRASGRAAGVARLLYVRSQQAGASPIRRPRSRADDACPHQHAAIARRARHLFAPARRTGTAAPRATSVAGLRESTGGRCPVFDSGFAAAREHPPIEVIPFEWALASSGGASAATEGTGARAVLVARTDGSTIATIASQTLALAPGGHRFSVDLLQGESDTNRLGFSWTLRCLPSFLPLYPDAGPTIAGSGTSRTLSFGFTVPSGCPLQLLQLNSSRLSPPISAEAQFDNVRITTGD